MKILTPEQLHRKYIKEKYDIEVAYLEGPTTRIVSGCTDKETKLICWVHTEQHSKTIAAQSYRTFQESQICYSKFHRIVVVSEGVKRDFEKIYLNVRTPDILYNTNETNQILELKNEKVDEKITKEKAIRICGVGKVIKKKGFDKLARVHKKLIESGFSVHTYILGVGDEKEKIEQYLVDNGIRDSFTFLGYQTNPYKYLDKMDIFVCSSSVEGFSTATTEALILGCAVVTTPVAGMKEMLGKNNEYGIITEMSEESLYKNIRELVANSEMLEYYKKQSRIRGSFFSKENTVRSVENYMDKLVAVDKH